MTTVGLDHIVFAPRRGLIHVAKQGAERSLCGRLWSGWPLATERGHARVRWCKRCRALVPA